MPDTNTIGSGAMSNRLMNYTGYAADGTTVPNADLKPGAIVQLAGIIPSGGTANLGEAVCRPTEGYGLPFCIVSEDWQACDQAVVNTQDGLVANLRRGGRVPMIRSTYCRARVKHGVVLSAGVTRLCPADGQFHLVPWIGGQIAGGLVAASTAVTNSVSTEQAFTGASIAIPAHSLRVGDIIRGTVQGVVSAAASTDTLTVKVKIGSNIVAVTGAPDSVTGDKFVIHWSLKVRTVGSSGTAVCEALTWNGTEASAAGAADIPSGSALASFTLDTTATVTISATGTWSATSATCTANLEIFDVFVVRIPTSIGFNPVAVAMESVTVNDSASVEALAKVCWLGPMV